MNQIDLRRANEGWAPATYVTLHNTKYDLTYEFASTPEQDILIHSNTIWLSPTIETDKYQIGHTAYNSRLLSLVIMESVTLLVPLGSI